MSIKRTWTHTAKDGNSTSTRLRKRADSEMLPPSKVFLKEFSFCEYFVLLLVFVFQTETVEEDAKEEEPAEVALSSIFLFL